MNVDDVRLWIEVIVPHALEKHRPGDDLAAVSHENLQEEKLARLEGDRLAAALHATSEKVHLEVGQRELGLGRAG